MTPEQMAALKPGDLVRNVGDVHACVVTDNDGARVTAVRTVDVTNPAEWEVVTLGTVVP